jgi:hypothetical protein
MDGFRRQSSSLRVCFISLFHTVLFNVFGELVCVDGLLAYRPVVAFVLSNESSAPKTRDVFCRLPEVAILVHLLSSAACVLEEHH